MKNILLSILTLSSFFIIAQNVTYVDIDSSRNNIGSSRTDAYTNAQAALNATTPNAEYWIAEGIYIRTTTSKAESYKWLVDSISVLGGLSHFYINQITLSY